VLFRSMEDGLVARMLNLSLGRRPTEDERPYMESASLVGLAYACLIAVNRDEPGKSPKTTPGRVIELALTQSDFATTLATVANKVLFERVKLANPTYRRVTKQITVSDFKPTGLTFAGDYPVPLEIGEDGEVKRGAMTERKENISLKTYARIVELSLALLVADDIGAFTNILTNAAIRVADHANDLFFAQCLAPGSGLGPVLTDSARFFDASHANIANAGTVSIALDDARSKLRAQSTPDGVHLNAAAAFLVVSPTLETLAEETVAKLAPGSDRRISVLADANLGTSTRYYLFADPTELPAFVHASLADSPRVVAQPGWSVLGADLRVNVDHGFAPLDHRGCVTGVGA